MNLKDLRDNIDRKIKAHGTATVTRATLNQCLRPRPENDLLPAGDLLCQGKKWDVEHDTGEDILRFKKTKAKNSAKPELPIT